MWRSYILVHEPEHGENGHEKVFADIDREGEPEDDLRAK